MSRAHCSTISAFTPFFSTSRTPVLGWPPNRMFALLCLGVFLCCATMSMPQGHLVSLWTDLGISGTRSAAMLSATRWFAGRSGGSSPTASEARARC